MTRRRLPFAPLPLFGLLPLVAVLLCASSVRADVHAARATLYADYASQLTELAGWCREHNLDDAAKQLRAWLPQRDGTRDAETRDDETLTLFVLEREPAEAKEPVPEWRTKWHKLRAQQADALMALARDAIREHHPSLAYQLVTEAIRENPDHKQARRFLGYVPHKDTWRTPFEIRQLGAGRVWHDKFGWLPKTHVDRYEKGQRHYQGRWMTTAEEALLRADLKRGWRVESEHYIVTTNHSLEEGVSLSRRLEQLHAIWQQVFVSFVEDEAALTRRLDGRGAKREPKQHNVVYYRSRAEYNDALRAAQPKIDITLGIYFDQTRTAHFFAGAEQEPGTLFHEATHQLFQETQRVAVDAGRDDNFWIVEGIACYMESLAEHDGHWTLGGANAGRMPAARHRLLEDNFYVPLAELTRLGMRDLQSDPRIARLYSQSAGLADFLMHARQGKYREPAVQYLLAIYRGRAAADTLSGLTGVGYETLDREYREFMSPKAAITASHATGN